MEDLIYLEEELPEINIREIVDDKDDRVFVTLDDSFIEGLAADMYGGNMEKGADFLRLLKSTINNADGTSLYPFAQYKVNAYRTQNVDDSDEEEMSGYMDTVQKLFKVPYDLRQSEMDRISMPFTATLSDGGDDFLLKSSDIPSSVHINLNTNDTSILTIKDNTSLPIQSAAWSYPKWTSESYITEAEPSESTLDFKKPSSIHENITDFLSSIQPNIAYIIPKHQIDLHNLKLVLSKNGYNYDLLTNNQLSVIAEELHKYDDDDDDNDDDVKKGKTKQKRVLPATTDKDAINGHLTRADAYMTESRRLVMQTMFDSYVAAHPQFSLSDGIDLPFNMVSSLLQSTATLEELVTSLKDIRERVNTKLMRDFFISLMPLPNAEELEMKKQIAKPKPLIEDTNEHVFMSSFSEIDEIKQGSDTSQYVGIRTIPVVFVDETYAAEPDAGPEDTDYMDEVRRAPPPDIHELERSPDHLNKVFMDIQKIVDMSCLPWDYNTWLTTLLSSYPFPPSRADRIRAISSQISEFVVNNIAHAPSLEAGLQEIGKMSNEKEAAAIKEKYSSIFKEWANTCTYVLVDGLTFWALDILERSIQGTLFFKLPNNKFAQYWSPYGYPIESAKATRGVFVYISHISGVEYDTLVAYANSEYAAKIAHIKENKKVRKDKFDEINKQFGEALEENRKNKKKPEFFLRSYVPMYLHLPSLIKQNVPTHKQPVWAQGCCITPLGETYHADADLKGVPALHSIKVNLGKKKWLKAQRPPMKVMASQHAPPPPPPPEAPADIQKLPLDIIAETGIEFNVAAALDSIAPSEHIADYNKSETAFNIHIYSLLKTALPSRRLLQNMNNIVDSIDLDANHYKNMIKALIVQDNSLIEIKTRVDKYQDLPVQVLKYMLAFMIEQIDDQEAAVKTLIQLKTAYVLPTADDVQDFINKRREESKEIKRRLLDVLNVDDRETVMQARKLGIINYANLPDMAPIGEEAEQGDDAGAAYEAEGEAEFAQRPTDDDRDYDE